MENNFFPIFPFARASKSPTLCLQKAKKKNGFPFHSHIWWRKMEKLSSMFCVWFRSNLKWHLFALRLAWPTCLWSIGRLSGTINIQRLVNKCILCMAYLVSHISLDPRPSGHHNPVRRHRKSSCVCICRRYTGIDGRCTALGSISGVYLCERMWGEREREANRQWWNYIEFNITHERIATQQQW